MKINSSVIKGLITQAKKELPFEACGYLASREGLVSSFYALSNKDRSSEHFSFDPKEQFAAVKDARAKGLAIRAVYHSHPASPARPSPEDIKLAYDPEMIYVIVSLAGGREDIGAFKIKGQEVSALDLEVVDDQGV